VDSVYCYVQGSEHQKNLVAGALTLGDDDHSYSMFDDRDSSFYTGLLDFVIKSLNSKDIPYIIEREEDVLYSNPSIDDFPPNYLTGITLRPYQQYAAMIGCQRGRGIYYVATRGGKTEIAISILKYLQLPTLYLVNRRPLMKQTYDRFVQRGIDESQVSMLAAGIEVKEDALFFIGCSQTIYSLIKKKNPRIRKLLQSFRVLLLDEAQFAAGNSWTIIASACVSAHYRFGFSGTPFKVLSAMSRDDMILRGLTGDVLVNIPYGWLKSMGYVSNAEVYFVTLLKKPSAWIDPDSRKGHRFVNNDDWHQVYQEGIAFNRELNSLVVDYAIDYFNNKRKILLLIREHVHARQLLTLFYQRGYHLFYSAGGSVYLRYNGEEFINESKAFMKLRAEYEHLDSFILLGSPIYKFGVDLPYLDTIINLTAGRGLVPTIQSVSRGTTLFEGKDRCIILDFNLEFSYVLKAQARKRSELYQTEGYDVIQFH